MTATHHDDLEFYAGDDWTISGVLLDLNGAALDLTGAQISWTLIDPGGLQIPAIQGGVVITPMQPYTLGHVTIVVNAALTSLLLAGRYHDALRVSIGLRSTYWVGSILVNSDPFSLIPPVIPSQPVLNDYLSGTSLIAATGTYDAPDIGVIENEAVSSLISQNVQISAPTFGATSHLTAQSFAPSGNAFDPAPLQTTLSPVALSKAAPSADAWCWFHEPRAVSKLGKLWFGTSGADDNSVLTGRASMYEVDENLGSVLRVDLATSTVAATWADDHDYPSSPVFRPDGRLVTFYCPHRTGGPINFRISVSPNTMADGWSQEYSLGNGSASPTYPSPVFLSAESNKLYLFYRNGSNGGPMAFIASTDIATVAPATVNGGALGAVPTWSVERQVVISAGTQGIYHKVTSNGVDRIDILMTDATQPTDGGKFDVRHTYFQGGSFYTSDGVSLGDALSGLIPFANFTAVATSLAPDNFGDMWVDHIQRRSNGIIEGVFHRFLSTSDNRLYYCRWNGTSWFKTEVDSGHGMGTPDTTSTQITDGQGQSQGYYSPGAFLDTAQEGVIYCGIGTASYSQLYRYQTTDTGATWTRQRISGLTGENVRPVVPVGRTTKYSVLWLNGAYHNYDFTTNPAAADSGYTTHVTAASLAYVAPNAPPVNILAPSIAGVTLTAGNVLQGSVGSWTGEMPMPFTYQWTKGGVNISGATSSSYTITAGDVGSTSIVLRVTATNYLSAVSAVSAAASALPTNLLTHSETFNQWTFSAVTVTSNVANDPVNGALVADRMIETTALIGHSLTSNSFATQVGTAYTFSVYAKYETAAFIQLLFGSAAFGSNAWANFDIQNGVTGTISSSATASIQNIGNGWFRLSITATATASTNVTAVIFGANSATMGRATSYTGSVSNTRLLADAQIETGNVANTYVPTA